MGLRRWRSRFAWTGDCRAQDTAPGASAAGPRAASPAQELALVQQWATPLSLTAGQDRWGFDVVERVKPTAYRGEGGVWRPLQSTVEDRIMYRIIDRKIEELVHQAERSVPQAIEVEEVWTEQAGRFGFYDHGSWGSIFDRSYW